MNQINIPANPADKDIQILRSLFKKYSKQIDGHLSQQELGLLAIQLAQKPMPYEINSLFQQLPSFQTHGIDQDTFIVWYLGFLVGIPNLQIIYGGLKTLQKHVQSAAPSQVLDQSIKHSFVKFQSQTNQNDLKNQIFIDILLNPQKTRSRVQYYQKILKKLIGPVSIVLNFQVETGKAAQIREQVEGIIALIMQLATQLAAGSQNILKLININCGNTQNEVIIVIETQHALFSLIADQLNSIIHNVNPNLLAQSSLLVKSNSLSKVFNDTNEGLSSSLEFDLKIDGFLLQKLRETIIKINENNQSIGFIFGLLLQQIKLQVKTNNIKQHLLSTFGIQSVNLSNQANAITQQVNIQQLIQSFLPPQSQQLIKTIRNAQSANVCIDLFVGCLNFRVNLKLLGTNELFDLIM